MPISVTKNIYNTFSRAHTSPEAYDILSRGYVYRSILICRVDHLFAQLSNDLSAYAVHAGRSSIQADDVILLMKRLKMINDKKSVSDLIRENLSRDLSEQLLSTVTKDAQFGGDL